MWTYTLRNLMLRKGSVAVTVGAVGFAIGATIAMIGLLSALVTSMEQSGSVSNAIVLKRNAQSDLSSVSSISQAALEKIKIAPGIARNGGQLMMSAELVTQVMVKRNGRPVFALFRGVDPVAYSLHHVTVQESTMPSTGQEGLIVGGQLLDSYAALKRGEPLKVNQRPWPVLGTLSSSGTKYESEFWADRTALMSRVHTNESSSVTVQLERPEAIGEFVRYVSQIPDQQLDAMSERDYYRRASEASFKVVKRLAFVMTMVLAIGAISATTTMVYVATT
jgi:hypothetical protein